MNWKIIGAMAAICAAGVQAAEQAAQPASAPIPAAILTFEERGTEAKGLGPKIGDILYVKLATNPDMMLVDRAELQKTLDEQEISLSGMVSADTAVKVGQLTGARLLITGSVMELDRTIYMIAKVIGSETSRVVAESVKGKPDDKLDELAESLGDKVAALIKAKGSTLLAPVVTEEDRVAALKKKLGDGAKPSVVIGIPERHVGQITVDPAAETELSNLLLATGFRVLDKKLDREKADIRIEGEAFSELAVRRGNLVSVKARVEVKAVDVRTGNVLVADRQTAVAVDLSEQIAGKTALQKAAAELAERVLPKLKTPVTQFRGNGIMFCFTVNILAVACSRSFRSKMGGRPWAALAVLPFTAYF